MALKTLDRAIESQTWLDRVAGPVQQVVSRAIQPGPIGTPLRDVLDGTWLGHPLHPALTDVPVGAWTTAFLLDALSYLPFGRRVRAGADLAIGLGVAGALGSAVSGLADWSYTRGPSRRLGIAHGLTNVAATALYAGSLALRRGGNRPLGRGLAALGYGVVLLGAYLGAELAYRCGIGVHHAAFEQGSTDFVGVLPEAELREGQMRRVEAAGMPVLLTRWGGTIYAIGDTCAHLGCSLAEGTLEGDVVTCPCHGSQFRVTDGEVVRGPAAFSESRFDVRVVNGQIQVRRAEPACL